MSFRENVESLQNEFRHNGYSIINEPYDISILDKEKVIDGCEIIARKDFFNIIYMQVKSNWRSIATEVAKKSENSCLVITRYGDSHTILSTMKDHSTLHAKPRYVVLDTGSKPQLLKDFIKSAKVKSDDDYVSVDEKVQDSFDKFFTYQQAIDEFAENLEDIIKKTKDIIEKNISKNSKYDTEAKKLLKMCQGVINENMNIEDIKEMLIQHVLTYRLFVLVYDEYDFHTTNAVARSLELLKTILKIPDNTIDYKTMELVAESITDADQRQEFLKKTYETFYEKYNPAKADKDGIVYTPSEVVNFMVKSTDQLLKKHFKKSLSDKDVTILDPAAGTGTFPVNILREISIDKLEQKYTEELHVNEISVLPYYIATLNIEHTYKELKGEYKEFENICWMDTLDSGTKDYEKLTAYFEGNDNVKRIQRQQKSKICVVIGNPPYNATQTSFNNANPADKYPHIDKRIQEDYSKYSTVQNKNTSIDMYKRFLKWSSMRIRENGMVAFVSNNSFLDAKADDGIRKALYDEFDYIYTVNLKGNARTSGELRREQAGNVFRDTIKVGITISFFVKTGENKSEIHYTEIDNYLKSEEKLKWLADNSLSTLSSREIMPDKEANWLNQTDNDYDELPSILPRDSKESIFEFSSLGSASAKNEWTYSISKSNLREKMRYYISVYNEILKKYQLEHSKIKNLNSWVDKKIKWSSNVLNNLKRKQYVVYSNDNIKLTLYRPFIVQYQYYGDAITERLRKFRDIFKNSQENILICFPNPKANLTFSVIGTNMITDMDCITGTQNIPFWQYNSEGKKCSNITKYGLTLFQKHYKNKKIIDEEIFYYVYAMFNDPKYEEKYRFNLQRHFPRIPLAENFEKYYKIGKKLFDLHCNFNNVTKYGLQRIDKNIKNNKIRLQLKKEKERIRIIIDDATTLENIPKEVYEYTLGSKNPLEWILEFYKESKHEISPESSNDEKIRKKFNTYKFADHKEELITLLNKVTTVCVETVKLRKQLEEMEWGPQPKLQFTKISKEPKTKKIAKSRKRTQKSLKKDETAQSQLF